MPYETLYRNLKEIAYIECGCDNESLIAPIFHEDHCRYKIIAEEGFRQAVEKEVMKHNEAREIPVLRNMQI